MARMRILGSLAFALWEDLLYVFTHTHAQTHTRVRIFTEALRWQKIGNNPNVHIMSHNEVLYSQ